MKIEFTESEYSKLLDMLFLSEWIMDAFKVEDDDETKTSKYRELRKKIMSYVKNTKVKDKVIYDGDLKEHFFTLDQTDKMHDEFINQYNADVFWDGLGNELTIRDMKEESDRDPSKRDLPKEEFFKKYEVLRNEYEEEFDINGINNLRLVTKHKNSH